MKNKIARQVLFAFAVFLVICLIYKGSGYTNQYFALITVSTFIFGIYLAFSIYNNQAKLSKIKELLRTDDAEMLALYKLIEHFSKSHKEDIQELIDDYLISQLDYKLIDYNKSSAAFLKLYDYVSDLNPKTDKQMAIYKEMIRMVNESLANRTLVGTLVGQKITTLEWFSIYTLLGIIDFFIIVFNTSSVTSSILSAALATTAYTLVLVLKQLDSLRWQEDQWVWGQLHELFLNLDLVPYYPAEVISQKRASVASGSRVRLASYPNPYPDITQKTVETVTVE